MLHKLRNGERWRPVGQNESDYPLRLAFNELVNTLQYFLQNLLLRFILVGLLLIQLADVCRIDGNDVLSFFMYLHCSLYFR
jgi:hypothetical protein